MLAVVASVVLVAVALFATPWTTQTASAATPTAPVQISKTDENGTALKGAQLQVSHKDANGNVVVDQEWTTDGTDKVVYLPAGDYTLTEISAPAGYQKAADQTFTVQIDARRSSDNFAFNLVNNNLGHSNLTSTDGTATVSNIYCFNATRPYPTTGVRYTEFEGDAYAFNRLATQPRGSAQELYQNVLRVLYNGYPNAKGAANGIQQQFNLTDDEFHDVTQQAIWYYTDSIDAINGTGIAHQDAVIALIHSTATLPNNVTLDIFESEGDTVQNLLSAHFTPVASPMKVTMVDYKAPAPNVEKPKDQPKLAETGSDIASVAVAAAVVMMLGAGFVLRRFRMKN